MCGCRAAAVAVAACTAACMSVVYCYDGCIQTIVRSPHSKHGSGHAFAEIDTTNVKRKV